MCLPNTNTVGSKIAKQEQILIALLSIQKSFTLFLLTCSKTFQTARITSRVKFNHLIPIYDLTISDSTLLLISKIEINFDFS